MRKTNIFKKFTVLLMASLMASSTFVFAQDEEITDEDLKNYAVIEMSKDMISSSIKPFLLDMIAQQEGMTGNRWMELQKTKAEGAEDWEVKFYNTIMNEVKERSQAAKDVVNLLINNTNMTAAKYQEIKSALGSDSDLKAKYEEITASLN